MKTIKILSITGCLAIASLASFAFMNAKLRNLTLETARVNSNSKGFAVVELFTSEGCSSCPAADDVVAKIEKESAGQPVYILAFHVDYWNRLGWKDIFSSADYTRRQNNYANWLRLSSIYTPQVVVNGRTEFVGSQEGTLRNAIRTGLQKTPKGSLSFGAIKVSNNKASVPYTTEGADNNSHLMIALIQRAAVSKIGGGENKGRTLSHVQIVHKIENIVLDNHKNGTVALALPRNFTAQGWEIIAFLQNPANGEITAATHGVFPENITVSNN